MRTAERRRGASREDSTCAALRIALGGGTGPRHGLHRHRRGGRPTTTPSRRAATCSESPGRGRRPGPRRRGRARAARRRQPAPRGLRTAAAQAAEAFNGARYEAAAGPQAAGAAPSGTATSPATTWSASGRSYSDAIVSSYEMGPSLSALSAIAKSDGIGDRRRPRHHHVERREGARQASTTVPRRRHAGRRRRRPRPRRPGRGRRGRAAARPSRPRRRAARRRRRRGRGPDHRGRQDRADRASSPSSQDISVALAQQRQSALEEQARAAPRSAARQQALREQRRQQAARGRAGSGPAGRRGTRARAGARRPPRRPRPHPAPAPAPARRPRPTPAPAPGPTPAPAAAPAPAPAGGAAGRDRLRQRPARRALRLGRRRPDAWDCSGLTMGAWAAGGQLAAALLGRAVRAVHPDLARAAAARATWCSGARAAARRRSTTSRSTSATAIIARAAHRPPGRRGVHVLLDPAELLRPALTRRCGPIAGLSGAAVGSVSHADRDRATVADPSPAAPTPGRRRRAVERLGYRSRVDVAALTALLDGRYAEVRDLVRTNLAEHAAILERGRDAVPRRTSASGSATSCVEMAGHRPDRHGLPRGVRRRRRHRRLGRGVRDARLRRPVGAGQGRRAVRPVRRRDPPARHQARTTTPTSPTWSPAGCSAASR